MKCPSKKFLHLFVDGELDPDTKEYLHIKNCEKCLKEMRFYQKIADDIKASTIIAPSGLVEKIKARVSRNINIIKFNTESHILRDNELESLAAAKKEEESLKNNKDKNKKK